MEGNGLNLTAGSGEVLERRVNSGYQRKQGEKSIKDESINSVKRGREKRFIGFGNQKVPGDSCQRNLR